MSKKKGAIYYNVQFVTSCISTTMVLLLLGVIVFSVISAYSLSNYVKENIKFSLLLSDETSVGEAKALQLDLGRYDFIRSKDYISREDAAKEQAIALGADPEDFLGHNPYTASIEISLKSNYANSDSIKWIEKQLKLKPKVLDVVYQEEILDVVNQNTNKICLVLLVIAFFMTMISVSLITNTVRLSIYSRRFVIHTMKLVGASWSFIRRPFLIQSLWIGLIAAVVANVMLVCAAYALYQFDPDLKEFITPLMLVIVCASVFMFGIIITLCSSYFSVNRYLKLKDKDLYYI